MLTALMISTSLVALMIMSGLYEGMVVQMVDTTTKADSGEVLIQGKNYRETEQLKYRIKDPRQIEAVIKDDPRVKSYVKRVRVQGLVATAGYSRNISIIGMNIREENHHSELGNFIKEGKLDFGKRGRGVVIGQSLAKDLKVKIGKKVIVTTQDINNEVVSVALKIRGITNSVALTNALLMSRGKLQSTIGAGDSVTQICVIMDKRAASTAYTKELNSKKIDSIQAYDWTELYSSLKEMEVMMVTFSLISYAFVFLVASLGIFGVVLVSVLERIREFGIMLAIGSRFRDIAQMIVMESLFISTIGYIVGALVGWVVLIYLRDYGLDFTAFSDAFLMFGMDPTMKAIIKPNFFTDTLIAIYIATLLAVIIPIWTLKRRKPIESIKEI